ncbi:MAG: prepilin-type N-terminal cleavage/methylation domain-containing protein [Chitinophagaceae bacterium]|jgi:prepilin-type N-terminal cleavage/methylation domain-containing protein|nr:prepilin-type N-terminal cleavage/methylation domain-containing protein [Chitinophagaceae bacterium]
MKTKLIKKIHNKQAGFGLAELLVVILIIAIIGALALPQMLSSRRLFRFSGFQKQVSTILREARQQSLSQRKPITFQYDDNNKKIVVYGGSYGNLGDAKNQVTNLTDSGLSADEVEYGRPAGVTFAALSDGVTMTNLTAGAVEVKFQADGSVVDASDNPQNRALFFYNAYAPTDTAFAISILGAGGRVKMWRYSEGANLYVE